MSFLTGFYAFLAAWTVLFCCVLVRAYVATRWRRPRKGGYGFTFKHHYSDGTFVRRYGK